MNSCIQAKPQEDVDGDNRWLRLGIGNSIIITLKDNLYTSF